jgi:hypothetical protein
MRKPSRASQHAVGIHTSRNRTYQHAAGTHTPLNPHAPHRITTMSEKALMTRARKITNVAKLMSFIAV